MIASTILMAALIPAGSEPLCGVTDPDRMTADEAACVREMVDDVLAETGDPLAMPQLRDPFGNRLVLPHSCSAHGLYPQAQWPANAEGRPIEIDAPLQLRVRFSWQEDGRTGDIVVSAEPGSGESLSPSDIHLFETAVADALALWERPPACIEATETTVETVISFVMAD